MNDNLFRILAIIIFVMGAGISIYYRSKADRESGERVSLKDEGLPITLRCACQAFCSGWVYLPTSSTRPG
jgi:hypothetical protein